MGWDTASSVDINGTLKNINSSKIGVSQCHYYLFNHTDGTHGIQMAILLILVVLVLNLLMVLQIHHIHTKRA